MYSKKCPRNLKNMVVHAVLKKNVLCTMPGPKGRYVDQPILGKLAFSLTWKLCQSQKLKNITPNLSPGKATFVFNIGKYV